MITIYGCKACGQPLRVLGSACINVIDGRHTNPYCCTVCNQCFDATNPEDKDKILLAETKVVITGWKPLPEDEEDWA